MSGFRFGIWGTRPDRVSRLGRQTIGRLRQQGGRLVLWMEGAPEPGLPWDLDQPAALEASARQDLRVCTSEWSRQGLVETPVDFLLKLDPEPVAELPQVPVWRFATPHPGPLAFWDVYDGAGHVEIRLDALTADPTRTVALNRRWVRVDPCCSYERTVEMVTDELAGMAAYVARQGPDPSAQAVVFPPPRLQSPSGMERTLLRCKLWLRVAAHYLHRTMYSESWSIGWMDVPGAELMDQVGTAPVHWLPETITGSHPTQPFLAAIEPGWLLLAQSSPTGVGERRIVQQLSPDGTFKIPMQPVLKPAQSYPFLVQFEGDLYCLPGGPEGVSAWRWDEVRRQWADSHPVFHDARLEDASVVFYQGRWWLFAVHRSPGADALHVFFAESLWGPWQPHQRNPVKVDVRSSAPAGALFVRGENLFRPAQDCSRPSRKRMMLNQVIQLTPSQFREEVMWMLDGAALGVQSVETLSTASGRTVLAARTQRFSVRRSQKRGLQV